MDIINIFQELAKKYINNTEDAGCGMRNVWVKDYIVQCYVDDSFHNVWILSRDKDGFEKVRTITDFNEEEQIMWLEWYYNTLIKGDLNLADDFSPIIKSIVAGDCALGKLFYMDKDKRAEAIQEEIINWDVEEITEFMHLIGRWDENTILVSYSPQEVGELVNRGIEHGWDVNVEIERGRDYFLFAKEEKRNNYFSRYNITGHIDEFDEIAGILDIWGLVGLIMTNNEEMEIFLDFATKIREKHQKSAAKFV